MSDRAALVTVLIFCALLIATGVVYEVVKFLAWWRVAFG